MTTPWHEEGKAEGQRQFLRRLLETKFGPLDQRTRERLEKVKPDQLEDLGVAVLRAQALKELGFGD